VGVGNVQNLFDSHSGHYLVLERRHLQEMPSPGPAQVAADMGAAGMRTTVTHKTKFRRSHWAAPLVTCGRNYEWQPTSWWWELVTCEKCRRLAPLHWRRRWGMAA
jgi:hypothetical protein